MHLPPTPTPPLIGYGVIFQVRQHLGICKLDSLEGGNSYSARVPTDFSVKYALYRTEPIDLLPLGAYRMTGIMDYINNLWVFLSPRNIHCSFVLLLKKSSIISAVECQTLLTTPALPVTSK